MGEGERPAQPKPTGDPVIDRLLHIHRVEAPALIERLYGAPKANTGAAS